MICPDCGKHRLRRIGYFDYRNRETGRVVKQTIEANCPSCGKVSYRVVLPKGITLVFLVRCYVVGFFRWLWGRIRLGVSFFSPEPLTSHTHESPGVPSSQLVANADKKTTKTRAE
jgi:hypothetical protein